VTRRNQQRNGFTLVELMVVLAIIVVLVSLLMAGFSAVRITQQERATDDIVRKVQTAIEAQRSELVSQAAKERREKSAVYLALLNYCENDEERAQALHTYLKLRHAFPQTWAEAKLNVGIPGVVNLGRHKAYQQFFTYADADGELITVPPEHRYHNQSAALLYMAVSNMATGGATFATDDATSGFQISIPFAGGAATVFKDARGNPIGFKRFHENPMELNAAPYTNVRTGLYDPFDPLGKLASWANGTRKIEAQNAVGVTFSINNKSITAYSFGQDKTAGTADDVYGYRLFKLGNQGSIR
jgi:prepilin-type N-terminal cleavage/methylation domain-containing protein